METLELHNNFILLHEFQYPDEFIKQWVRDDLDYAGNYHNDWERLMNIINKIEEDQDNCVSIARDGCKIDSGILFNVLVTNEGNKLLATYSAVVEYVKWHNENN